MKFLKKLRNNFCYCGIEKEEYKQIKKNAYISNFEVWKKLNFVMVIAFAILFITSFFNKLMAMNLIIYGSGLAYSLIATVLFFVLKKDSIWAQLLIYLSISILLLVGALLSANKPDLPTLTFIVMLLVTPMFMIDKPYFMAIEHAIACTIFLVWMYFVKDPYVFKVDLINTLSFAPLGIVIHIISNSYRIKEFVLIRQINIQKDIDELTGLKNKSALTREINKFIERKTDYKQGLFFVLDIDKFKEFNDTFGHDVGDIILEKLGKYLKDKFEKEIVGRFGGDEFIIFIKNNADVKYATKIANEIATEVAEQIVLPSDEKLSVSMGISIYRGEEKNYSEIFKKADIALYKTKADRRQKFNINE